MPDMQTYTGGCHFGAVRFEVTADLGHTITCNCSLCAKRGLVLGFAPADQFKVLSGEDALTDYQFHKKKIHHVFCRTCGVESFSLRQPFHSPITLDYMRFCRGRVIVYHTR